MKKQFLFASLVLGCSLFVACGGSSKSEEEGDSEDTGIIENISNAGEAIKGLNGLEKAMKDIEAQMNALKEKTPVSNDELKKVLPETLEGLKRNSINLGESASIGVSSANATYQNEDASKTIEISILDGAGEAASSITGLAFYGFNKDSERITDDMTEKTMEYKGQRAKLTESKFNDRQTSTIEWLHKKRYLMKVEGEGYSMDEVGKIMDNLALGNLPE
ncbi:hypothetical protein [Sphingobacterium mizutaii]|uniref:hypothetical protein n=1 Tax=Sphingobacterium mizutaii TaxID=1010 RepID=UPI0028A2D1E1|nr:hypothetical protein [Sphingobacterium mizutaii]